ANEREWTRIGGRMGKVIGYQLSVISYRLSVIGYQLSVIRGQERRSLTPASTKNEEHPNEELLLSL
ncbi:MAG TPA: hypothetical protein VFY13_02970, partial [Luteolibacter sp.]|nr:hypothetical protein [Luteolibacter sp.]